jgi:UDP-3-O-[3-hydroxymyristoyl] N-acetylglucosamine deacetylase
MNSRIIISYYRLKCMQLNLTISNQKQRTISKQFTFEGQSLFSTETISMEILPASVNSGIYLNINGKIIPAVADYLNSTELHTTSLAKDGESVLMIEHLSAAIYGLGIDNLEIRIRGNIVPAQDGSAGPFAEALTSTGIVEQEEYRKVVEVTEPIHFKQPEFEGRNAVLKPLKNSFKLTVNATFPDPIGTHIVTFKDGDSFIDDVSWARTFLRSPLDLNDLRKWNDIRTVYKALPEDPRESPIITFTENEFLTPLKREDEPAVHKLLDTLGDLVLVGYRIHGDLNINIPGHKFTHQIAKEIRRIITFPN